MSLRQDVLPIIQDGWELAAEFWYETYALTIRTRTWAPQVGDGAHTDSDITIEPNPPVKELEGGKSLKVGPIIPSHTGGGYTPQQLNPAGYLAATNTTVEILHVVTGPDGVPRDFVLTHFDTSDPGEYILTLEALDPVAPR